jgi:DNA-binding XRE family transcriptional regulator
MNREDERARIGQRIAAVRKSVEWTDGQGIKRKGMTQGELAERCGLAQSHIARIERGYYSAGYDQLQAIAEALGKNIDLV